MDSLGRKIMYIGLQLTAPSFDRPNNRPDRVWNGPGDVVAGVPPIQAHALCQHKEEWADVTSLKDDELLAAQKAARAASEERVRVLKNPKDAPNNKRSIDALSDDELEAELQRRREARGDIDKGPDPAKLKAPPQKAKRPKGEQALADAIGAAVERVLTKSVNDKETTLLDDEGVPTLAAVQEELGYSLSEDEYRNALGIKAK